MRIVVHVRRSGEPSAVIYQHTEDIVLDLLLPLEFSEDEAKILGIIAQQHLAEIVTGWGMRWTL